MKKTAPPPSSKGLKRLAVLEQRRAYRKKRKAEVRRAADVKRLGK